MFLTKRHCKKIEMSTVRGVPNYLGSLYIYCLTMVLSRSFMPFVLVFFIWSFIEEKRKKVLRLAVLRLGVLRFKKNLWHQPHSKLGIGHSAQCPCDQGAVTAEHNISSRPALPMVICSRRPGNPNNPAGETLWQLDGPPSYSCLHLED
jgi:hypothetical protein